MLTEDQRRRAAEGLLESHRTKVQGQRPSERFPEIAIEDSYAISSMIAERRLAEERCEDYCVPRVEPVLTFVLKEPLKGPGVGLVDLMRATEWVVPSIETIDARVTEPRLIFDTGRRQRRRGGTDPRRAADAAR